MQGQQCFCLAPKDQDPFGKDEAARATMSNEFHLMQRREIVTYSVVRYLHQTSESTGKRGAGGYMFEEVE